VKQKIVKYRNGRKSRPENKIEMAWHRKVKWLWHESVSVALNENGGVA
jgi:hypothetical protein